MRVMTFAVRAMSRQTGTLLTRTRTAGKPTASGSAARLEA
jgi:hypothetical protein